MRMMYRTLTLLLLVGLAACASGPRYDTSRADTRLTATAVAAAPTPHVGKQVLWGGIVVTTRNQPDYTEIEILSYPLDSAQRPQTGSKDQGRFLARLPRYLESIDYAPGRRVTVIGTIEKTLEGKVGEAPYTFPLVRGDDIYLWAREANEPTSPRFHFGVGVIFSR